MFHDKTINETWAQVEDMHWWGDELLKRKEIDDHCRYKYLAHVEGGTYSGRLK